MSATTRFQAVWKMEELLGKGQFGHIYEVTHKASQRVEAVKVLSMRQNNLRQVAQMEAKIWSCIGQHRNIVKLHEFLEDGNDMFMVMEKCECHILSRLAKGFRMRELAPLFQQMLSGIAHLHSTNIVHRDIKLENFLCVGKGLECVKLCDFGFATVVPLGKDLNGRFGTPPYMSPEMLTRSHNTNTDIWSMGVCVYFLISGGNFPYEPEERSSAGMKLAIARGSQIKDFEAPKNITFEAKQFAITLLNRRATSRFTAEEVLQQPFLRSVYCRGMSPTPSEQSTVASEQDSRACKPPTAALSEVEDILEERVPIEAPVKNMLAKRSISPKTASKGCFEKHNASAPFIFEL